VGYGLSIAPQNQWEDEDSVEHMLKSTGLLRLEATQVRVSQFCLKLEKERRRVVHVASSCGSCGSEAKDGRFVGVGCDAVEVRPNYLSLDVIFILAHRGIIVFWSSL
jgi:hypothetical protein